MNLYLTSGLAIFCCATLMGCSKLDSSSNLPVNFDTDAVVSIDKDNGGKTVVLKIEQILDVALSANPTTGYEWEVTRNNSKISPILGSSTFEPNKTGRAGAPTIQHLRFRASEIGSGELELGYRRPWEKDKKSLQTWKIKVEIQK